MSLRDEINSAPRGTKAALITKTGLCNLTIVRATTGARCSPATAQDIAAALGAPDRWPELVVVRRRHHKTPVEEPVPEAR